MTDKKKIGDDEEKWTLFETLLEMWDSDKLIDLMRSEYQRGYDQGQSDYRDELLKGLDAVHARIANGLVPKTADKVDLDKYADQMITHDQNHKPQIAKSIEEVKPPAEPEPDPPIDIKIGDKVTYSDDSEATIVSQIIGGQEDTAKPKKPASDVPKATNNPNGRPASSRPAGIPSNFEMAKEAIEKLGGRASAPQIKQYVENKWWPNPPKYWTSTLHDMAGVGKLSRDGINFILPKKPQQAVAPPAPKPFVQIKPQVLTPPPIAKLGPPSRTPGIEFKFGDKVVILHEREHKIARRLRAAMGAGHLDSKFLADAAGYHAGDKESWLKDMVSIMAPKLATVGLEVEFFKGFGFIMKELAA